MKHSISTTSAALLACIALSPALAYAQAARVFVAAQGSDGNPCTFAAPCRTFQHAHDTVAAGGEIDVLDPAGYGAVTITKALSIQGHGFSGISVASGGTGITISAGANDTVSLNGLAIDGGKASFTDGILFGLGRSLVMKNCVVRGMSGVGLIFAANGNHPATLSISDSLFSQNGSSNLLVNAPRGPDPANPAGPVTISIDRSLFVSGLVGIAVTNLTNLPFHMSVTDSVLANNDDGIELSTSNATTDVALARVLVSGNQTGIFVNDSHSTLRMGESTVTGNTTGYQQITGTILSYGDNYIDGNGANSGALGGASKQ
jgi:hypothetical protein